MKFTGKRVVIVGGAGYLGSRLRIRLMAEHDVINIDPLLRGDEDNINLKEWRKEEITSLLDYVQPDHVVNLAALAHDPTGQLHADAVLYCNAQVAFAIHDWCNFAKIPDIHISSAAVFDRNGGRYITSKRLLESGLLACDGYRQTNILRLGTLYGPSLISSWRPHLLLNSMVCGAVLDNKIVVNGNGLLKRPVTNIIRVVDEIAYLLQQDRPKASLYNLVDYCGTLRSYAELVRRAVVGQRVLGQADVEIEYKNLPDNRDYGWTGYVPLFQGLPHYIQELAQWVQDNADEIQARRDTWFDDIKGLNDEIVKCLNLQNRTLNPPTSIR